MRKAKLFIGVTAGVFIFWSGTIINSSQLDNQNTESSFGSILLVIGIALTLLSFLYIISNSNRVLSILDKVLLASITYLFIEIFLLILTLGGWFSPTSTVIAENSIYVWNKPCAKYDSIAGYKWVDSFRVVSMNTDEVHFDEIIHSNKQGYVSYQDYLPHKKDSTISRYIVLGDSFTAGAYLKTSWPDYCQKQLSSDTSITPVELYNFSVDGGGIHNWHSIFFNEVVPQYEFDAVIIAIFPGDLSRDFFILNHQEDSTAKYGYFKQKPASRQDFNLTFLPKMEPVGSIMSDRKIDDMILHATDKKTVTGFRPILFYELISIKDRIAFIHNRHNALSDNSQEFELYNYPDLTKLLIESYGKENSSMFLEIMNWCNIQDKEIIISLIPYKNSINTSDRTYIDGIQVEGASIAANFNGHFFDGYQLFQKLTHSEINECFINGDVHWNQTGSDYFANGFSKFLKSLNSKQSNN